jgi:hypothetical protein
VNCWDTFTFNTSTCTGIMMEQTCSKKSKLLGYFYFQPLLVLGIMMVPLTCSTRKQTVGILSTIYLYWDNDGTLTYSTEKIWLLGYFYSTTSTCTWDNDGTTTTCSTRKSELLGYLLSTPLLVLGIMMEPHNHHRKNKLLGYFYFQQFYLYLG